MKGVDHSYALRGLYLKISWYFWETSPSKAISNGIVPNTSIKKLTSIFLGFRVFILLLVFLKPFKPLDVKILQIP